MPRFNVIILDRDTNDNEFSYVLWADVPVARQPFYANANAKSAWAGATTADNTALQNGSVVEQSGAQRVPVGATTAQMQAFLQQRWTDYQAAITAANPWQRYGSTWDGTTWVLANNG